MALSFSSGVFLLLSVSTGILSADGLDALIGQFQADRRDLSSAGSVPWNATSRERGEKLIAGWEKQLESLDYAALDGHSRIDWHLLKATLQERRADSELTRIQTEQIEPILAFSRPIQDLLLARSQRQLADPEKSAAVLNATLTALKETRKKLESGRTDPPAH